MRGKMKAAVLHKPLDIRIEDVEIPQIEPDEVLVRMNSVGICGSDAHFYLYGRIGSLVVKKPMILGHECSGEVAEVGEKVSRLKVGQKAVVEPGFTCGKCQYCRGGRYNLCKEVRFYGTPHTNGAFAEYAKAPEQNVYPMPNGMTFEEGAMIEPLAVGMMAAKRGGVSVHNSVAILGAGPIGQMVLQAVKAHGVLETYVTDVIDYRLDYARKFGATAVTNTAEQDAAKRILELTDNEGVDVVIEASGAISAGQQAFDIVKPGGRIVLVGNFPSPEFQVPMMKVILKELDVRGIHRYVNLFPTSIRCVSTGKIDVKSLITHRFPLEKIVDGIETQIKKIGNPMKIQIQITI